MAFGAFFARRAALVVAALLAASPALGAQATQYTYDALGRVISAIDANGKKVVYSYDGAGNRTRVSNGAEFTEITVSAWSASSNAGTTGLTATNGMKDGDFNALASIHATNTEAGAWIKADLGSAQTVNHIDVAPALASTVGAAPADLDDTVVEYSVDGSNWSLAATINGVSPGATRTITLGGVTARYVRIRRALSGQVAIGDLRFFSAAAANSPLIANPDSITSSGSAVTFDPRTNDQDLDGYSFTISSAEDPPHGSVTVNSGASVTYTPDAGYFGADSFLYSVADGHNGTASARVTVLVRPSTNHAPVAVNDSWVVSDRANTTVTGLNVLRPLDNDYDSDGDVLSITGTTSPSHGSISVTGASVEYTPTTSYGGSDSFTYTISDGRGGSSTGSVNLTVGNANPIASPDSVSAPRNGSVTFDAKANDRDPNGDSVTISSVGTPSKGTATLNGDQTITYTASSGASGTDTFTYALSDGRGGTAAGSVIATISPNSAPQAVSDNISLSTTLSFDPRFNDIDVDGDALTIVAVGTPGHGTATILGTGTSISYSLNSGYTGDDAFTYTVADASGSTSTASVAVNSLNIDYFLVGGGGGGGGSYGGGGGGGGTVQGTTALAASGSLSATVGAGGAGSSNRGGSGAASSFAGTTAPGGGGGGGGSTAAGASGASGGGGGTSGSGTGGAGTAGLGSAGGNAVYLAGGGGGGASSVGGVPSVSGNTGTAGSGGSGVNNSFSGSTINYAAGGGGGGYYVDEDLMYVTGGAAGGASAAAGGSTGSGSAAPANAGGGGGGGGPGSGGAGGSGVVMVRYLGAPKATGGTITQVGGYTFHKFTAAGTFSVTANNAAPTAVNDSFVMLPDSELVFDPRANDSDPNSDPLYVGAVAAPSHGTAAIAYAGTRVSYRPTTGYTGSDSFSYTVTDGQGLSSTATVSISVQTSGVYEYLVVAGGGGGGNQGVSGGGGGGGGGVVRGQTQLSSGSYSITVGAGGAAETNGSNSSLGSIATATGGGKGGRGNAAWQGDGGSGGGGGGHMSAAFGVGTLGQGQNGAPGSASPGYRGGGGGGATTAGTSGAYQGNGGEGFASSISGASVVYGSGGGGGGYGGTGAGAGGTNAGAGSNTTTGGSASANKGGGGGGGASSGNGGAGGSGVVILRYYGSQTATGGTVTSAGGYTIHTFTSSGTFVVP